MAQRVAVEGLATLAPRLEPAQLVRACDALLALLEHSTDGHVAFAAREALVALAPRLESTQLVRGFTTPEIVELLKSPLVQRDHRRAFLDPLECRYGNQWAFVDYAQSENLGLTSRRGDCGPPATSRFVFYVREGQSGHSTRSQPEPEKLMRNMALPLFFHWKTGVTIGYNGKIGVCRISRMTQTES